MSNPNNPFDETIWEPGGEHVVEDPFHGPSAVFNMLQTPAMPLGDGNYYQPGAYSIFGTFYVDSNGRPSKFVMYSSMLGSMRRSRDLMEWLEAVHEGETAVTRLEASRQRARLEQSGRCDSFKQTDVCGGGERIDACEAAGPALEGASQWAERQPEAVPRDGVNWMTLAWLGGTCTACGLGCSVAVKDGSGEPIETRFTNYEKHLDVPTLQIDATLAMSPVHVTELSNALKAVFKSGLLDESRK